MTSSPSKSKRGRKPKKGKLKVFDIRLRLWVGEDDDLIAFLESIPSGQRPTGLKIALRSGGALADLEPVAPDDAQNEMDFDLNDFLD